MKLINRILIVSATVGLMSCCSNPSNNVNYDYSNLQEIESRMVSFSDLRNSCEQKFNLEYEQRKTNLDLQNEFIGDCMRDYILANPSIVYFNHM